MTLITLVCMTRWQSDRLCRLSLRPLSHCVRDETYIFNFCSPVVHEWRRKLSSCTPAIIHNKKRGADNKSCLLQMIGSCVVRCFCWFKDFSSIKDIYKTCGVDICVLIKSINRRKSPNVFLPANTNPSA